MKMIPVDEVPRIRNKHDLTGFLKDFADRKETLVRIDFTEYDYKSATVCRSCLGNSVKRHGYNFKVMQRGNEVYLKKL